MTTTPTTENGAVAAPAPGPGTPAGTASTTPAPAPRGMTAEQFNSWDVFFKTITVVATVVAGLYGAAWAVVQVKESRRQQFNSTQKDFQIELWRERIQVYVTAANAAAKVATLEPTTPEWDVARHEFWRLYWGELAVLEDEPIQEHMVLFGRALKAYTRRVRPDLAGGADAPEETPGGKENSADEVRHDLEQVSLYLARTIRRTLDDEWRSEIGDVGGTKASTTMRGFWDKLGSESWENRFTGWAKTY